MTAAPRAVSASAPAKVILLGEHGVNRHQPALVTAIDLRVGCSVRERPDGRYSLRSGGRSDEGPVEELAALAARVDALREAGALDEIRALAAADFFAPLRYVLARLWPRLGLAGLDAEIRSAVRIGAGLGSGAAASCALVTAATRLARIELAPAEVAALAWDGDVVAHGGVASALDASGCAHGGVVRYSLRAGASPVAAARPLPLVVGDTLVTAATSEVNTRVRLALEAEPARAHLFAEIGLLTELAVEAVAGGDRPRLGALMNLNQLALEKLGVSSPELDRLVSAALGAGALGAKLSGSGGGGIVVALTEPGGEDAVARAIEAAGGRSIVAAAGVRGAREET